MADITTLFKATVKTVKSRQKLGNNDDRKDGSNGILSTPKQTTDFVKKCQQVVDSVRKLNEYLVENRVEYLKSTGVWCMESTKMSDTDRDHMESMSEEFIRNCESAIKTLRASVVAQKPSQIKEHRLFVIELLQAYLKSVCKSFSEMRAIRVKRAIDKRRLARLAPDSRRTTEAAVAAPVSQSGARNEVEVTTNERNKHVEIPADVMLGDGEEGGATSLSPAEVQMFEQENQKLFEELSGLTDEVRQLEGKVVEISRLQEIFTEKILQQEQDIDRVADLVVNSTEDVKAANEDIREAMKNNAGLRIWILFFLIVCTFTLLFLDWYNP